MAHLQRLLTLTVAVVAVPGLAWAGPAKLIGAKPVATVKPQAGFVDSAIAFDSSGQRLAYVNADAARLAQLRVLDLAGGNQVSSIDISKFTTTPVAIQFAPDGKSFFVVSRSDKDKPARAALIDPRGKVKRKFGPADHIRLIEYRGKPAVVTHTARPPRRRGKGGLVHTLRLQHLITGRRLARPRTLVADKKGYVKKLDFRIAYWANDFTRAVGIKGGVWIRKENQRSPDVEAWYEVFGGRFSKKVTIADPMAHTLKMKRLAKHDNQPRFVMVKTDRTALLAMDAMGAKPVSLAAPFTHYKPETLRYQQAPSGLFFTLEIDPVNPDALARRRSVPRYLDLYFLAQGSTKAVRKARMLLPGKKRVRWWASANHWIIVPRHIGFDRGGPELRLLKVR